MAVKNTVAIIGAAGSTGSLIARAISNGPYRLLIMDKSLEALSALRSVLALQSNNIEIDVVDCCKDASWEADIIVVAVPVDQQEEIALKIREVATCKTVISIISTELPLTNLQSLLPHSKVITVTKAATGMTAIIEGCDREAIETAVEMIKIIGLPYSIKSIYEYQNRK